MKSFRFSTTVNPDYDRLQTILDADPERPHVHCVDMPHRLTTTWQDQGCEMGIWEQDGELLAWALLQSSWWNLDYPLYPSQWDSLLERDVLAWGQEQIKGYSKRTGEEFFGSVEFFQDAPNAKQTTDYLETLGFREFDWSIVRFELDLRRDFPLPQLPEGFAIRPLRGRAEVEVYVNLHRAAFGSKKMTTAWRMRTLKHPAYRPDIDLVVVNPEDEPVGFCICWMWRDMGQIEPLGVHPEYRARGLGRALELTASHSLRRQGVR